MDWCRGEEGSWRFALETAILSAIDRGHLVKRSLYACFFGGDQDGQVLLGDVPCGVCAHELPHTLPSYTAGEP